MIAWVCINSYKEIIFSTLTTLLPVLHVIAMFFLGCVCNKEKAIYMNAFRRPTYVSICYELSTICVFCCRSKTIDIYKLTFIFDVKNISYQIQNCIKGRVC
jgi:hypothetical protein